MNTPIIVRMPILVFKDLFRSSPCFDNLQKIHILRAVPAIRKPFSMGLLSWLATLIALPAIKSHCWEKKHVVVLRFKSHWQTEAYFVSKH